MIVIAHRGACGYLPEHTLAAKALAYGMGADYLEQDVVLTRDDHPIVLHDVHLDGVTNVCHEFPGRQRDDGRYYAIDFTLDEIKRLCVHERVHHETNQPIFSGRFPVGKSCFAIPTLREELEFIQGLNQGTGKNIGIYPEIKKPAWHRQQGKDISALVLKVLGEFGYNSRGDPIYLQCFDPQEMRRLREEFNTDVKLVQLIGDNKWNEAKVDFDALRTDQGIQNIAKYADGVGVWISHLLKPTNDIQRSDRLPLVEWAHAQRLEVHPFTLRTDDLPEHAESFESLFKVLVEDARVDGIFTDFPDKTIELLSSRQHTQ